MVNTLLLGRKAMYSERARTMRIAHLAIHASQFRRFYMIEIVLNYLLPRSLLQPFFSFSLAFSQPLQTCWHPPLFSLITFPSKQIVVFPAVVVVRCLRHRSLKKKKTLLSSCFVYQLPHLFLDYLIMQLQFPLRLAYPIK